MKHKDYFIRSSRHTFKHANSHKRAQLQEFIQEYQRVAQLYVDHLWSTGITLKIHKEGKTTQYHFDTNTHLNCPLWLSTVNIDKELNLNSFLTARVKKCIINQVLAVVRGTIEKQRKRQFVANDKRAQKKKINKQFRKALRKNKPTKPDVSHILPEINSICLDYQEDDRHFSGWLRLSSFTNRQRAKSLNLPVRHHRHSKRLQKRGELMNSFLLSENQVDVRWKIPKRVKSKGKVFGGDPGERNVLTLGNDEEHKPRHSPKKDQDGWTLRKIEHKISRKKRGSKSIKKCYKHRLNHINWSINQVSFHGIKELRYEKNTNIRKFKKNHHRNPLSHWTYSVIHAKVKSKCEDEEVLYVSHDDSTYMSQRCSSCGLVLKSNRTRDVYSCKNCGWTEDSDYNASLNHQQDLCSLPYGFRKLKLNRAGFFWKETGLFSLTGEELAVPLPENECKS